MANLTVQFIASQLNVSLAKITVNKTDWTLIGVADSSGIVRSYQLAKGNGLPCLEITLLASKGFIFNSILYKKTVDRTDKKGDLFYGDNGKPERIQVWKERPEMSNPRAVIDVIKKMIDLKTHWALTEARLKNVTDDFLAHCCIADQLGFEVMTDRQVIATFADATRDQLLKAEATFLELMPQYAIAADQTVNVEAITASVDQDSLKELLDDQQKQMDHVKTLTALDKLSKKQQSDLDKAMIAISEITDNIHAHPSYHIAA